MCVCLPPAVRFNAESKPPPGSPRPVASEAVSGFTFGQTPGMEDIADLSQRCLQGFAARFSARDKGAKSKAYLALSSMPSQRLRMELLQAAPLPDSPALICLAHYV